MSDLPPLKARPTERDKEDMEAWVNRKLDEVYDAWNDWCETLPRMTKEELLKWTEGNAHIIRAAIDSAEHGNIEPLRAHYPHLARFLHLPKRSGKGDRFPPQKDYIHAKYEMPDGKVVDGQDLTFACWDVPVIKELWKTHYGKKMLKWGYPTPEDIAARRYDISDAEHVYWFLNSKKLLPDRFRDKRLELARVK
jgi:hypothetical protein